MPLDLNLPERTSGSFLGGYSALGRMARRRYDPNEAWAALDPYKRGTMAGGLTYDHLYDLAYNPLKYTTLSPSRELTKPILMGAGETTKPRVGAYTLDMIDWNSNLAQLTGTTIGLSQPLLGAGGQAEQQGVGPDWLQNPVQFFNDRGIDPLVNGWVRLFDYALAPAAFAAKRLGVDLNGQPAETPEAHRFPFQNQGSYWAWLRDSTAEERGQMAQYQAERTAGYARNAYLRDELARTFEQDYQMLDGKSSGDPRVDYLAKLGVQTPFGLYYPPVENVANMLTNLPFFGTQIAEKMVPITADTEAKWQAMTPAARQEMLTKVGILRMGSDMLTTLPLFSGVSTFINAAHAGAFGTIATRAAEGYTASLRVTNGIMATGLTVAAINWGLEAASPEYSRTIGEEIDSSRVVSNSVVAGLVNTTGMFTGFYGIETAVPAWFRALRHPIGEALPVQAARGARGLTQDALRTGVNDIRNAPDVSFHAELGGTKLGKLLEQQYGIDQTFQGTAISVEALQTLMNLERDRLIGAWPRIVEGKPTGIPWLDAYPIEARVPAAEAVMANLVGHVHEQAGLTAQLLNGGNLDVGLNPGPAARKQANFARRLSRQMWDGITMRMLADYGPQRWPGSVPESEALVQRYLAGMGRTTQLDALRSFAGKDIGKWQQIERRMHQLLFHKRNGELHTAAEGSGEADRIGLVDQSHLFADQVEEYAATLSDSTQPEAAMALYRELVKTKRDVQVLEANGVVHTPDELAVRLLQIAGTLPSRRPIGPTSAAGKLNDFQRELEAEGFWSIGFKPTGKWTLPGDWVTEAVKPPPDYVRPALTPDDLVARGYRSLQAGEWMLGTEFSKREPIWPVDGGVWVREVPGEQVRYGTPSRFGGYTAPTTGAGATVVSEMDNWLAQRDTWLPDTVDDPRWMQFEPKLDNAGNEIVLRGGNRGWVGPDGTIGASDWPVLIDDTNGDEWLFKADWKKPAGGVPYGDLSPARRISAATTGKLMQYLGLRTSQEVPFMYRGVKGTIQRIIQADEVPLDMRALDGYVDPASPTYAPQNIEAMQKNMVLDWLVGNDDTNAGSFLTTGISDEPLAIDKGRSFAYIFKPDEVAAFNDPSGRSFWTYRSPQALQTHLGEFLLDWVEDRGVVLSRQVVEDTLTRIEGIPEQEFRDWLRPLAEARVQDGRFEANVDDFLDKMWDRRNNLRAAVNRAYTHIGSYALPSRGQPIEFKPGQAGLYHVDPADPVAVNSPQQSGTTIANFHEPELPDAPRYKAGIVIEEGDGRLWLVDPRGQWGGHNSVFPKGQVNMADILNYPGGSMTGEGIVRNAALRETMEETGFSVTISDHLLDHVADDGTLTRYYVARRNGGGPSFAHEKETENVVLLQPDQAKARLTSLDASGNWVADPREQAVLEAWMDLRHPQADTPSAEPATPLEADPTLPGDGGMSSGDSYQSWVKFENGSVFHSPWLDYPMSTPAAIELGNRSVFMQKFDDVFRGWRTFRLAENQRAALHRRMNNLDIGMTPARIDMMHNEILRAASNHGVPPQAFTLAQEWMPFAKAAYKEVGDIAEKYMGKGPYLHSDGTVASFDARHELSKAYQTSLKLNLTAGLTSRFYTMGTPGRSMSYIAHVIYPALRFGISPLFKGGEFAESWAFNGMRGVNPFGGDPFTEQLLHSMNITRQRGAIRAELNSEPMLQGMSMGFTPGGAFDMPEVPGDLWLNAPVPRGLLDKMRRAPDAPDQPQDLLTQLYDHPVDKGDIFPAQYADTGVEILVPHDTADNAGNVLLNFDGRARDDIIIGERFNNWIGNTLADTLGAANPDEALHRFAAGLAFVDSLGSDYLDRLTGVITPAHSVASTSGKSGVQLLRENIENGTMPAAGWPGRGRSDVTGEPLVATGETTPGVAATPSAKAHNTSIEEMLLGHIDAVYAGFGPWMGGDASAMLVFKDSAWKRAVITDSDRIGLMENGPSATLQHMLTPEGAYRALRQAIFEELHAVGSGRRVNSMNSNDLLDLTWSGLSSMRPVEVAVPHGIDWDGIEAVVLHPSQLADWGDLVTQYADQVPALKDIKVIPLRGDSMYAHATQTLMGYWMEKAGLGDKRFIDPPDRFYNAPPGTWARYVPDEIVSPQTADSIIDQLTDTRAGGLLSALGDLSTGGGERWRFAPNLEGEIARQVRRAVDEVRNYQHELEAAKIKPTSTVAGIKARTSDLEQAILRRDIWTKMATTLDEWRSGPVGSAFDDLREAEAALTGPKAAQAQAWIAGWHELLTNEWLPHGKNIARWAHGNNVESAPMVEFGAADNPSPLDEYLLSRRSPGVYDRLSDRVVTNLPREGDVFASPETMFDTQKVAFARFLLDRLRQLKPSGYEMSSDTSFQTFLGPGDTREALRRSVLGDFRQSLVQRAQAKGKPNPGEPIVNVWVRGDRKAMRETLPGGQLAGGGEMVITVMGVDGKPYGGFGLDELAALWRESGMPFRQSEGVNAGGSVSGWLQTEGHDVVWLPDGGPNGSVINYDRAHPEEWAVDSDINGRLQLSSSVPPERLTPVRFAYTFDPAGHKDFVLIAKNFRGNGGAWRLPGQIQTSTNVNMPFGLAGADWSSHRGTYVFKEIGKGATSPAWRYHTADGGGYTEVQVPSKGVESPSAAREMVDDLLGRVHGPAALAIGADNDYLFQELYQRMVRGDLPFDWVVQKRGPGWPEAIDASGYGRDDYVATMTPDEWKRWAHVPEEAIQMTPVPAPNDLADVRGGPEHLTKAITDEMAQEMKTATGKRGQALRDAWDSFWNPVPYKERQQDRLIRRIVTDMFPAMLKLHIPDLYDFLRTTAKVPDQQMVEYIGQDRRLLDRWLATGDRGDFTNLLMHAEAYTGKAEAAAARAALDELYTKPEWNDLLAVLHQTMKTAQDEAFNVHFFNPYRSYFERSINHPLLGVYPASWAYKAAKEWFRFLYDNDMFSGFRLGMAPAAYISHLQRQQAVMFAQAGGQDLDKWERDGPLGSTIFIFNLLMPGDWSALPFPLSRSLRDAIRGNLNPFDHFQRNLTEMGVGRDLRLFNESTNELVDYATGKRKPLRQNEEPWTPVSR